jgi:hypothetical protein
MPLLSRSLFPQPFAGPGRAGGWRPGGCCCLESWVGAHPGVPVGGWQIVCAVWVSGAECCVAGQGAAGGAGQPGQRPQKTRRLPAACQACPRPRPLGGQCRQPHAAVTPPGVERPGGLRQVLMQPTVEEPQTRGAWLPCAPLRYARARRTATVQVRRACASRARRNRPHPSAASLEPQPGLGSWLAADRAGRVRGQLPAGRAGACRAGCHHPTREPLWVQAHTVLTRRAAHAAASPAAGSRASVSPPHPPHPHSHNQVCALYKTDAQQRAHKALLACG